MIFDRTDVEKQLEILKRNADQEFKLFAVFWIVFMQCGFALLEAGAVRSKNTTNILFKNLLDIFVGALSYWIFGYAFAFGVPGNAFIGHNFFFSIGVNHDIMMTYNSSQQEEVVSNPGEISATDYYSQWLFQFAFAATASTIVSGAMAERTQFAAYLIYSFIITGYVYPIISHWCWSDNGFLRTGAGTGVKFLDFAGSGVVHVSGGTAALVGAKLLGPRIGRFSDGSKDKPANSVEDKNDNLRGHSVPLVSLGAFILFTGFLAFNGGSQQTISNYGDGEEMSLSVINTLLAGASGAVTALVFNIVFRHFRGKTTYWSLLVAINGGLAGMVSSCAGSNSMYPWVSVMFGAIAAVLMIVTEFLLVKLQVDDPIGAVPVHLAGGLVGILLAPIFVFKGQVIDGKYVGGMAYAKHSIAPASFGWNLFGTFCIVLWTGLNCAVVFGALKMVGLLRVTPNEEMDGLDIHKHGEPAYPETYHLLFGSNESEANPDENQVRNVMRSSVCILEDVTISVDKVGTE